MFKSHLSTRWIICAFMVAGLLVLSSTGLAKTKFGKISDGEWRIGPPEDYPEANAVVIIDEGFIDVNIRELTIERIVRIKVLTKAGIEEVGERMIRYHEDDKVKNFKAHTVMPGGKKQKVKKDAIFERTDGSYKEKVFSFPQVSEGCILEYSYRIVSERYYYLRPWYFQGSIYTLKSTVGVRLELGFDYNASFYNVPPALRKAEKKEEININYPNDPTKKLITYSWTLTNLPPVNDEPFMGALNDYRSSVKFQLLSWQNRHNYRTFVTTWDKLGDDLIEYYELYLDKKGDIERLAKEITAGLTSPREQSRALYEYVKTEYASSYDYTSRDFVHEYVGSLLEQKYGSPEGKNLLLVQMHRALSITAFPVLISTRDHGRIYADNPDARQFNYILAYLEFGDGWELLDAANKNNPYGVLPPDCLVQAALLVDKGRSELIRIPDRPVPSSRTDEVLMCIDGAGSASCSTVCRFTGYYASQYSERYEEKQLEDFVKDWFVGDLSVTYTLGDYDCELDSLGQFITEIDFDSDDLAERLDNNLAIIPVCYCFKSNPFKSEKRSFPVDFMYPFTYRNIVKIELPGAVASYQLPADTAFNINGASFERQASASDSCVVITSTLKIDQPMFRPSAYGSLRRFFEQVALTGEDELVAILNETE